MRVPTSRKHTYIILTPLKPHFYTGKLGLTGVNIIVLISAQNTDCGYSLEPPRRGGSNEYPQSMFWAEIWTNIRIFYLKIFLFLVVKFSIYLNRRVFVMKVSSMNYIPNRFFERGYMRVHEAVSFGSMFMCGLNLVGYAGKYSVAAQYGNGLSQICGQ